MLNAVPALDILLRPSSPRPKNLTNRQPTRVLPCREGNISIYHTCDQTKADALVHTVFFLPAWKTGPVLEWSPRGGRRGSVVSIVFFCAQVHRDKSTERRGAITGGRTRNRA